VISFSACIIGTGSAAVVGPAAEFSLSVADRHGCASAVMIGEGAEL
jgi:hypothetical protein